MLASFLALSRFGDWSRVLREAWRGRTIPKRLAIDRNGAAQSVFCRNIMVGEVRTNFAQIFLSTATLWADDQAPRNAFHAG
jgi:hypothetical protein